MTTVLLAAAALHAVAVGPASLRAGWVVATGQRPIALAAGDLDGDGQTDLVAAAYLSNQVVWYRGPLSPGAQPAAVLDSVPAPVAMALADLDGDHALDLAVASGLEPVVRVRFGDGRGGFTPPVSWTLAAAAAAMAAGDVDGDGVADLVVGGSQPPIAVLHGDPGRTFTRRTAIDADAAALIVADADGDGRREIWVARALDDVLEAYSGSLPGPPLARAATPIGPAALVATAERGRGVIVVAGALSDEIVAFAVGGRGRALTLTEAWRRATGKRPSAMAVIGPAGACLATACTGDDRIEISCGADLRFSLPSRGQPLALAAAELTGDGVADVAAADGGLDGATLFVGERDLGFGAATVVAVAPSLVALRSADPCPGEPGLLLAVDGLRGWVWRVDRSGAELLDSATTVADGAPPPWIAMAADCHSAGPRFAVLRAGAIRSWWRDGEGRLCESGQTALAEVLHQALLVDLDGDGILDLTGFASRARLLWQRGQGDGTLAPPAEIELPGAGQWLRAGDGELVALTRNGAYARFALGPGGPRADAWGRLGGGSAAPLAADLDGDGRLDLVVLAGADALVYHGGEAGFAPPERLVGVAVTPVAAAAADLDRDGLTDLLLADAAAQSVVVWRGEGRRHFRREGAYAFGGQPALLRAIDFEGQGRISIAGLQRTPGRVLVIDSRPGPPRREGSR